MAKREINYVVCSYCLITHVGDDMCIVKRKGYDTYYCAKCNEKTEGTDMNLGLVRGPKVKKTKTKKNI